jgi:hypothetical protein
LEPNEPAFARQIARRARTGGLILFLASDDVYIVSAAIYDVIVGKNANDNG